VPFCQRAIGALSAPSAVIHISHFTIQTSAATGGLFVLSKHFSRAQNATRDVSLYAHRASHRAGYWLIVTG
jgi:hypothetical protein